MVMNQCDGCRRGLPLRDGWIHYNPDASYDHIACTADRYKEPTRDHVSDLTYDLTSAALNIEEGSMSAAQVVLAVSRLDPTHLTVLRQALREG